MDRLGPPPPSSRPCYERGPEDEEIREGIDGGDWYSGESDCPAFCERCGKVLRFRLTDCGVEYTLDGFEAESIGPEAIADASAAYELRELLEAGAWVVDRDLRQALLATAKATMRAVADHPRETSPVVSHEEPLVEDKPALASVREGEVDG